jgi:hypothetical protein
VVTAEKISVKKLKEISSAQREKMNEKNPQIMEVLDVLEHTGSARDIRTLKNVRKKWQKIGNLID